MFKLFHICDIRSEQDIEVLLSCIIFIKYQTIFRSYLTWSCLVLSMLPVVTAAGMVLYFEVTSLSKAAFTLTRVPVTGYSYEWNSYEWSVHGHSYKHKHL